MHLTAAPHGPRQRTAAACAATVSTPPAPAADCPLQVIQARLAKLEDDNHREEDFGAGGSDDEYELPPSGDGEAKPARLPACLPARLPASSRFKAKPACLPLLPRPPVLLMHTYLHIMHPLDATLLSLVCPAVRLQRQRRREAEKPASPYCLSPTPLLLYPLLYPLVCRGGRGGPSQRQEEEEGQGGGRHAQDARHDCREGARAQNLQVSSGGPGRGALGGHGDVRRGVGGGGRRRVRFGHPSVSTRVAAAVPPGFFHRFTPPGRRAPHFCRTSPLISVRLPPFTSPAHAGTSWRR